MATDDSLIRALLLVVAVVLLVPLLTMVFVLPMMGLWGGGHMWDGGMGNGMGAAWPWLLTWLAFLLVLLGGGYLLYRALGRSDRGESDPALEELRLAYARGELSDEEFEERRDRLRRER